MLLCSSVRCMTFWCVCNIDHICKTSNEPHPLCGQQTYLVMPMYVCEFQGNPTCTFYKSSSLVTLIFTRSTQLFSAKGIFCLYKGGHVDRCWQQNFAEETSTFWAPMQLPDWWSQCGRHCSSRVGTRMFWGQGNIRKFGTTFCLWPCPVLFGTVRFLPRTAAGPCKGDLVAGWFCIVPDQSSKYNERGKLYQFYPVAVGKSRCVTVSRWKPG